MTSRCHGAKKLSSKQIPKVAERVSRISLFERSRPVIIHFYRTEGSFNWGLSEQWIRSCFSDRFLRRGDQNGLLFCPNVQPYVRKEDMQLVCISKCYKAEWGVQALDPSNKVRSDAVECHVIKKKTVQTCPVVNYYFWFAPHELRRPSAKGSSNVYSWTSNRWATRCFHFLQSGLVWLCLNL